MQKPKPVNKEYPEGSLVFVWNADAGMFNAVRDSLHKWISPETYSCRLCELTHGFSSAKREWKNFLEDFERPAFFYYRDTFRASGIQVSFPEAFPLVLQLKKDLWKVLLTPRDLEEIASLEALITALKSKISNPQSGSDVVGEL